MKSQTSAGTTSNPGSLLLRPPRALVLALALACLMVGFSASMVYAAPAAPVISGPTDLRFIQHPLGFRATISWDAVPTATSYRVYDADTSTLLTTVTGTGYWLFGMQGVTYRRYVVAVDGVGDTSPPSNTLTIQAVAPIPPAAPSGYSMLPSSIFDLQTSTPPTGMIQVSVPYDPLEVVGSPSDLRLFHFDGSKWVDITTSVDTLNRMVIGQTSSFSPFSIMELNGEPLEPPIDYPVPASSLWSLALLAVAGIGAVVVTLTLRKRRAF